MFYSIWIVSHTEMLLWIISTKFIPEKKLTLTLFFFIYDCAAVSPLMTSLVFCLLTDEIAIDYHHNHVRLGLYPNLNIVNKVHISYFNMNDNQTMKWRNWEVTGGDPMVNKETIAELNRSSIKMAVTDIRFLIQPVPNSSASISCSTWISSTGSL